MAEKQFDTIALIEVAELQEYIDNKQKILNDLIMKNGKRDNIKTWKNGFDKSLAYQLIAELKAKRIQIIELKKKVGLL